MKAKGPTNLLKTRKITKSNLQRSYLFLMLNDKAKILHPLVPHDFVSDLH